MKIKILIMGMICSCLAGAAQEISKDISYKTPLIYGAIEGASKGLMVTVLALKAVEKLHSFSSTQNSLKPLLCAMAVGGIWQAYLNVKHNLFIDAETQDREEKIVFLSKANQSHKQRAEVEGRLWFGGTFILLGGEVEHLLVIAVGKVALLKIFNEGDQFHRFLNQIKEQDKNNILRDLNH